MRCNVQVIHKGEDKIIIRDLGPWTKYKTVTNDAEGLVQWLVENGRISSKQRLFYYDSEGGYAEIIIKNGKFFGFAPAKEDQ